MAHPKRAHFVAELRDKIPQAVVAWDAGDNNRWNTGRRALLSYDPDATHHVVVQDDAIVCPDFVAGIERLVEHVPDNPISLYTGRTRPFGQKIQKAVRTARAKRLRWMVLDELFWGVGVVLPTPLLREMVAFHDLSNVRIANYDSKMSFFFRRKKIHTYYTQPSLVDHRDLRDGNPSLVAGRYAAGRVAHSFIEGSPLDLDWGGRVLYFREDERMFVRSIGDEFPVARERRHRVSGVGDVKITPVVSFVASGRKSVTGRVQIEVDSHELEEMFASRMKGEPQYASD